MAVTNVAALAADLQTYFAQRLLVVAEPVMVFKQFANLEPIPGGSSKTISFTQYAKLSAATTPLSTEGTAPTDTALSNSAITAVVDQYGAFVTITDLAELTVKHPVIQEALYLLGRQAGETIDQVIQSVVFGGSGVQYANGKSTRANLAVTDVMTTLEIRKAVKVLRVNAAVPFDEMGLGDGTGAGGSGKYVLLVDASVEADITTDTSFVNASSYSNIRSLYNDEVGTWMGVRVVRFNNYQASYPISSTTTVHQSLLVAKNAFAVSDLQNLQMYMEGPGSVSDPLHQKRTLGWKCSFKTVILNNNFMLRIESGSAYN